MAVSVIASSILSCTKTPVQPEVPGDPEVEVVPEVFTVKAYHADDASTPTTRTSLVPYDSGNKQILRIQWAPHEEINFFDCVKKGGYRFQSTNQDYAYQVDFQKVGDPYVEQTDACYRAIYPYNKKNSVGMEGDDKNTFRAWIPAEQVGVPDTFADGMNVAIASSMTPEMAFRNICGGFKFTLANDDIAEVRLSGLEEEQLAGDVAVLYIPYDDETGFDMYFIGAGKDAQCISTLRMVPAEGAAFLPGREYYFVMMPATLTGFQFEFIKTNGLSLRSESRWMLRAACSLPVPVFPRMRTVASEFAMWRTRFETSRISRELPMSSPGFSSMRSRSLSLMDWYS